MKPWKAEDIVFSQGYGTRKQCRTWLREGRFYFQLPAGEKFPLRLSDTCIPQGGILTMDDSPLPWLEQIHVMLHKPAGYECSHIPTHYPSVFSCLPEPWVRRGLEAVGRLDADTTGLLLFTTDGKWAHELTSPKRHVEKVYRVTHANPLSASDIDALNKGILLRGDKDPTLPARVETVTPEVTRLFLHEGRYHQVKRMFAALGNKVTFLHRESVGPYSLPSDLEEGKWRWINPDIMA